MGYKRNWVNILRCNKISNQVYQISFISVTSVIINDKSLVNHLKDPYITGLIHLPVKFFKEIV